MVIGHSKITDMVLKYISDDNKNEIERYVNNVKNQKFIQINSIETMKIFFDEKINSFLCSVTQDELLDLRCYTGYNFKNINSILRNNWTYEANRILDFEAKKTF